MMTMMLSTFSPATDLGLYQCCKRYTLLNIKETAKAGLSSSSSTCTDVAQFITQRIDFVLSCKPSRLGEIAPGTPTNKILKNYRYISQFPTEFAILAVT